MCFVYSPSSPTTLDISKRAIDGIFTKGTYLISHSIPLPSLPFVPRYVVELRTEKDAQNEEIDDHEASVSAVVERGVVCSVDVGGDDVA